MNKAELKRIGVLLNCGGKGGKSGPCKKSDTIQKIASDTKQPMEVLGAYKIAQSGAVIRGSIDTSKKGDHGADPMGDGKFKMVPSGDIVDYAERTKRLGQSR